MSKVRVHFVDKKEKQELLRDFFEKITKIKSDKEVFDFFIGLLTASEILMISRRIKIAKSILENKTYEMICREIKVGCETVNRVDKWLHSGDSKRDNWLREMILKKIENKDKKYKIYHESLLDRYPNYRLLRDLFD